MSHKEDVMKSRIFVVLVLSGLFLSQGAAAQDESELNTLDDKFRHLVATKMPGWKHKRVAPMMHSANVRIQVWSFPNRAVKISIVPYKSAQEAGEVLRGFIKYESQKEELKGLGDEAYGWGYGRSNVVFTRGKSIVYVSTYAEVDSEPEARSLSQAEKGEREKSEMRRLSREFAKHMVSAIDLP
jgi:hypothetical protein